MLPDDRIRLQHILDAAREAMAFVGGKTRAEFGANRMLVLSVIKAIEILGEAASKVSVPFQREAAHIPWDDITAMRNRLIHGYFDINLDIVWQTVQTDLPELVTNLEKLLQSTK